MKPVKLKDIVDELEIQMDEYNKYLNKETGEIITVSTEELSIAEESEEGDDFSDYPDWQRDSIRDALDIIENWENYIELPDKWEIDEYVFPERRGWPNIFYINPCIRVIHGGIYLPTHKALTRETRRKDSRIVEQEAVKVQEEGLHDLSGNQLKYFYAAMLV
ncbi:MAG: hypothetical protein PWR06_441 [Thermoanaerobacteraceae bacterium]|nr:hypothetical protein [Thermoanaerobacteraceae bacterium]